MTVHKASADLTTKSTASTGSQEAPSGPLYDLCRFGGVDHIRLTHLYSDGDIVAYAEVDDDKVVVHTLDCTHPTIQEDRDYTRHEVPVKWAVREDDYDLLEDGTLEVHSKHRNDAAAHAQVAHVMLKHHL